MDIKKAKATVKKMKDSRLSITEIAEGCGLSRRSVSGFYNLQPERVTESNDLLINNYLDNRLKELVKKYL